MQCAERGPIRNRNQEGLVGPLQKPECDEVEERQGNHGDGEPKPTINQLFEDASVQADPDAMPQYEAGGVVSWSAAGDDAGEKRDRDSPDKNEPDFSQALERA